MRWRRHARHAPVAARENIFNLCHGDLPLPDLDQRSHDTATHLVEKSVALDDERQLRAGFFEVAARQRANVGFHFVTARARERFKIVFAQE